MGPTLRSPVPYVNGPEWSVFSALTALRPCFSLSAPCASVRVLEPTAKGPETPLLRSPNQRAAGSPARRPEDPLLEKPQACRLGGAGVQLLPANTAPGPSLSGSTESRSPGPGSRRRDRKPCGLHFRGAAERARRPAARRAGFVGGRACIAHARHFRARRGERGQHGGRWGCWGSGRAGRGRRGWASPRAPGGSSRPLPSALRLGGGAASPVGPMVSPNAENETSVGALEGRRGRRHPLRRVSAPAALTSPQPPRDGMTEAHKTQMRAVGMRWGSQ